MSSSYIPLQPASLSLDASGRLYSPVYDDAYHARPGELAQAEQVFLQGNGLPQRWCGRSRFTVCETGFGLGLNFLALWRAWRDDLQRSARLHMVSIEGHPFTRDDLREAWHQYGVGADLGRAASGRASQNQALQSLAEQLIERWPPLLPGLHRLEFEGGAVTLTLAFGEACAVAPRLSARVDAYFLDGFAPDRNPAMWSHGLLSSLARLAAPDATVASVCGADSVRQALIQVGFAVGREPGQDKRQTITGKRAAGARPGPALPDDDGAPVLVVGAGLAGAGVAQALAQRGRRVMVLAPADDAGAHGGHLAAALTPVIARDDNPRARLSRAGSLRACRRWAGLDDAVQQCGTLQLERDEGRAEALAQSLSVLGFPESWARAVDAAEATTLAGLPVARGGVFFSEGLLVRPDRLVATLLATPGIERITGEVASLVQEAGLWQASDAQGRVLAQASQLVLACAAHVPAVLQASGLLGALPRMSQMHALAGEVTQIPASLLDGGPRCIVGGEGYLLPDVDGWCVAGGTYLHGATQALTGPAGRQSNLGKVAGLLGATHGQALQALGEEQQSGLQGALPGWAGWRAVLPGRLPAIGPVAQAPGLWLATGYASRGLSWSALAGDLIAAWLCGEPLPLESDLIAQVAPR